jgi:transcriptional regulator with XRE-family HTH domain
MTDQAKKLYLSKKLKKLRDHHDLTQQEVAESAGIYTNHYARIERGEIMPKYETLKALAKVYGLKTDDLQP